MSSHQLSLDLDDPLAWDIAVLAQLAFLDEQDTSPDLPIIGVPSTQQTVQQHSQAPNKAAAQAALCALLLSAEEQLHQAGKVVHQEWPEWPEGYIERREFLACGGMKNKLLARQGGRATGGAKPVPVLNKPGWFFHVSYCSRCYTKVPAASGGAMKEHAFKAGACKGHHVSSVREWCLLLHEQQARSLDTRYPDLSDREQWYSFTLSSEPKYANKFGSLAGQTFYQPLFIPTVVRETAPESYSVERGRKRPRTEAASQQQGASGATSNGPAAIGPAAHAASAAAGGLSAAAPPSVANSHALGELTLQQFLDMDAGISTSMMMAQHQLGAAQPVPGTAALSLQALSTSAANALAGNTSAANASVPDVTAASTSAANTSAPGCHPAVPPNLVAVNQAIQSSDMHAFSWLVSGLSTLEQFNQLRQQDRYRRSIVQLLLTPLYQFEASYFDPGMAPVGIMDSGEAQLHMLKWLCERIPEEVLVPLLGLTNNQSSSAALHTAARHAMARTRGHDMLQLLLLYCPMELLVQATQASYLALQCAARSADVRGVQLILDHLLSLLARVGLPPDTSQVLLFQKEDPYFQGSGGPAVLQQAASLYRSLGPPLEPDDRQGRKHVAAAYQLLLLYQSRMHRSHSTMQRHLSLPGL